MSCACHAHPLLHKAQPQAEDWGPLWTPHENLWLRGICEQFSRDGEMVLQEALRALLAALGIKTRQVPLLRKAETWSAAKIAAVKAQLRKPLSQYQPADWLALIDLIIHTKLDAASLEERAAWLTARAQLAGRLDLAHTLMGGLTPLIALVPRAEISPPLTDAHRRAWELATARVGALLQGVTDALRARIARTIICHIEEHGLAARRRLVQALWDDFATANRDWRRIAITESGDMANRAYLGELPDGAKVKRIEAYAGACPFCQKLNGRIFIWSTRPLGKEYGWTHVWPGKTNEGRSSAPRKRTPYGLVPRTEDELWWPAAGTQHPNCRGRWTVVQDGGTPPGVDPKFAAWLAQQLKNASS